ncbi:nuclear transport factor 2 family protein [Plantactinospora soyae]|uniref:Ketosteroid isomerase-like protein n=1 Tax=Plantactinospora soyae TaxID=1544732 RepID=A0A927R9A7_9ACTN|nr:nuclear transport factor 2 family protein [Plantactinospora soyae]MBE1491249.1 ketosteroid isomerase-like protein [Plantactinospora soyae]
MEITPRDLFHRMRRQWLDHPAALTGEDLADDVVVELPFARPGQPSRFGSRQQFLEFANPQRAMLPVRFDDCRTVAIHDTTDPHTIVVEYELTGTSTKTHRQSTAAFVGVLTVRDGKIALWREYQDTAAILEAVG